MEPVDLARWRLTSVGSTSARFAAPKDVVGWLLGVQSQDYGPATWAVGQRIADATADVVEGSFNEGAFLRTHVLRPTWHFVLPDDIRWLLALTGPRINAINARMYREEGLDLATLGRAGTIIGRALEGGVELTRAEIAARLAGEGIEAAGVALGLILMHAELEGIVCSGARFGKQHTYALLDERVAEGRTLSREAALAELTRRYFRSHGPATVKDCATWANLTLTDVRGALEEVSSQLVSVESNGVDYWGSSDMLRLASAGDPPPVQLLQAYDEYVVGYTDSKPLLDLEGQADATRSRAIWNGIVLAGTQVAGRWKRTITKRKVTFQVGVYAAFDEVEAAALRAAVERHGLFLDREADLDIREL